MGTGDVLEVVSMVSVSYMARIFFVYRTVQ